MALSTRRTTCRLCASPRLELAVPLQPSAVADHWVPHDRLAEEQPSFPLDLALCRGCGHLQLLDTVSPEFLFRDYVYETSSSMGLVEHFRLCADAVADRVGAARGDLAVDIGSNDGTLLRFFLEKGLRVLGVDPATRIAARAAAAGVPTVPQFFTRSLAERLAVEHGSARIVSAMNVFAHADDLGDVADGVRTLLAPDGVFVFEVSYLPDILDLVLVDTVYHEHLSYHALRPLSRFLASHRLEIIDAERVRSKGGSIRVTAQPHGGPRAVSASVAALLAEEGEMGIERPATYTAFAKLVDQRKFELLELLSERRRQGRRIAGFGASATVTTMLHHFELAPFLEFLVDDNPRKHGLHSPGHHLVVLPPQALHERGIDDVVILAWSYAENIMTRHAGFRESGGRFVIPLPSVRLV